MKTALATILMLFSPLAMAAINLSIEGLVSVVVYGSMYLTKPRP